MCTENHVRLGPTGDTKAKKYGIQLLLTKKGKRMHVRWETRKWCVPCMPPLQHQHTIYILTEKTILFISYGPNNCQRHSNADNSVSSQNAKYSTESELIELREELLYVPEFGNICLWRYVQNHKQNELASGPSINEDKCTGKSTWVLATGAMFHQHHFLVPVVWRQSCRTHSSPEKIPAHFLFVCAQRSALLKAQEKKNNN